MDWHLPYPSRREPVLAEHMVATSQPLAVQAGLDAMRDGGNAVDAAVAAAAALTVVEPTSNGIGSDLFAIVWDGSRLHGLNASGRSPAALDAERILEAGAIALRGWDSVAVPGAVAGWAALQQRFGRLDLARLTEPAASYAERGFPVGPVTAAAWHLSADAFAGCDDFRSFLPGGRAPSPGERFAYPDQARTLRAIGATGGEAFYRGELAERIAAHAAAAGAPLTIEDLAQHSVEDVDPLAQPFRDVVLHELPPNGQGLAALEALAIADRLPLEDLSPDSADAIHLQAEAMKLAFADVFAAVADPAAMAIDPRALLAPDAVADRAARIDPQRAGLPAPSMPAGGTVYLCTADDSGMMVSLIQSNYYGFGSGVVVPGTGISLSNRAAGFSVERGHPNVVAGGKRPFNTIIPGFLTTADAGPLMAFGVMGGHMQPQGHLQVVLRTALWGQNPQAALDAPRWRVEAGLELALEAGMPSDVRSSLASRGHDLLGDTAMGGFGGGQAIARVGDAWLGASDPRKEGHAGGF